jgi:hypothetical protein
LRSLRLFDEEGLFIGDGSYLFVPDNEHYEGSDRMWFDEHNHPVDAEQADPRRHRLHRCYKLVSLIHINRQLDFFFTVAVRVVPGRRHECPILYELVDEVVRAVGRDVIKVLILDRGFIDGAQMGRLQQDYRVETILPVRANMDLHADALRAGNPMSRCLLRQRQPHRPCHPGSKSGKPSAGRRWLSAKPNGRPRHASGWRPHRRTHPRPYWAGGAACSVGPSARCR